jgi:hypothetical protein
MRIAFWSDRNVANDVAWRSMSSAMRGGIRNPHVDVPTKKIGVQRGAVPPITNAHPFVAVAAKRRRLNCAASPARDRPTHDS